MKIRTITIGLTLTADCVYENLIPFEDISQVFSEYKSLFEGIYEIQTTRITVNSFEEWLVPLVIDTKYYSEEEKSALELEKKEYEEKNKDLKSKCLLDQPLYNVYKQRIDKYIQYFQENLKNHNITMCNFGSMNKKQFYYFVPYILANSDMILMSMNLLKNKEEDQIEMEKLQVYFNEIQNEFASISPNSFNSISTLIDYTNLAGSYNDCFFASKLVRKIHEQAGDIGNFKFCICFNLKTNGPFFPSSSCTSLLITEQFKESYEGLFKNVSIKTQQKNLKFPILRIGIGLENGDDIYQMFSSMNKKFFYNVERVRDVLHSHMYNHCLKIQKIIFSHITEHNKKIKSNDKEFKQSLFFLKYEGIDSSINPGLGRECSVGNAIEYFLNNIKNNRDSSLEYTNEKDPKDYTFDEDYETHYNNIEDEIRLEIGKDAEKLLSSSTLSSSTTSSQISKSLDLDISDDIILNKDREHYFGSFNTLTCVSTITSALKTLCLPYDLTDKDKSPREPILLTGYNGLMLPVMEDYILSLRAVENTYNMKEILLYSTLCGVGIDTIPIPEEYSLINLANLLSDHSALASRLNKPLSCRVLPMKGLKAGEPTQMDNPYLCNSSVFLL